MSKNKYSKKKFFILFVSTLIVSLLLIFSFKTYLPKVVFADELEEVQQQKNKKEKDLQKLLNEIKGISASSSSLSTKIRLLTTKTTEAKKLIKDLNKNIKIYEEQLAKKEQEIEQLKKSLMKGSAYFYLENEQSLVVYILDSKDLGDFIDRMTFYSVYYHNYVKKINKFKLEQEKLLSQQEQLNKEKKFLTTQVYELEKTLKNLKAQQAILNAQLRARYATKAQLVNEITSLSTRARQIIAEKAASQQNDNPSGGGGGSNSGGGGGVVPPSNTTGDYVIKKNDGTAIVNSINGPFKLVLRSGGYFKISPAAGRANYKYRGSLVFRKDTNVFVINELSLEDYLKGIGEMPSSWHMESLKTQVVASRSYAVSSFGKYASKKYDVSDTVYDQNYIGVDKELSAYGTSWVNAVNATKDKVLRSGGSVIRAYFHSTCGGHTLSSSEVWGGSRSYAVAVSDRYKEGSTWKGYDDMAPRSYWSAADRTITKAWLEDLLDAGIYLKKHNNSKTAQDNVVSFAFGSIKNVLGNDSISAKVGNITNVIQIYNDGSSTISKDARKTKTLKIIGDKGEYLLDAQSFKLAYNIRSPGHNYIASTLYDVVKVNDNNWKFYSRGWGHRVGMCQYGAYGRAKAGQTYDTILKHYYTGAVLSTISSGKTIRVGITKAGGSITTVVATKSFDIVDKNNNVITSISPNTAINIERK